MTFRETITEAWKQFSARQKWTMAGLSLLLTILICTGGINFLSAWQEVRTLEQDARRSQEQADEAMKHAARIAQEILKLEPELKRLEEQRDEKQLEVKEVAAEADAAVADVDRARREQRADRPSAKQLCAELENLGYPCK